MKILYGVVGDGMGHAIRSSVVIQKLLDDGHEIHIVASGRAVDYLEKRFGDVTEIWGLALVMEDNEVSKRLTAARTFKGALRMLPKNLKQFFEVEADFNPDVAISDFETWAWSFAKLFRIPVFCIDNIQIINRCTHSDAIIGGNWDEFNLTKSVVKARTPDADWYLITTFFYPEIRKERTELVPPILRPNILAAADHVTDGEHLLVYQTSETFQDLPKLLKKLDCPVYVYGLRRDIDGDVVEDNITFRPFSDTQFVDDLASCRGVIASAGFTLMSESVHLGKPYLATPVRKQFEQLMNSRYLEQLGYGMYDENLDEHTIRRFIDEIPRFGEALESYERHDNSTLLRRVDELLDQAAADVL